jgi:hypothetical protein
MDKALIKDKVFGGEWMVEGGEGGIREWRRIFWGAFIREGREGFLGENSESWTRERFVFGIDTVTGVARGFGLGGPGYP